MELYIQAIFVMAILKYCLKAALQSRFRIMLLYPLGAAAFALCIFPIIIKMPLTLTQQALADTNMVGNMAIVITIEAIAGIIISIKLLDNYFRPKEQRSRFLKILKVTPGVLALAGIGYFESVFFGLKSGRPFAETAEIFAAAAFFSMLLITLAIRYGAKGESLKLEMKMLLNLFILGLGMLVNSTEADYSTSNSVSETDPLALCAIAAIALIAAATGFAYVRSGLRITLKNLMKHNRWN